MGKRVFAGELAKFWCKSPPNIFARRKLRHCWEIRRKQKKNSIGNQKLLSKSWFTRCCSMIVQLMASLCHHLRKKFWIAKTSFSDRPLEPQAAEYFAVI